MMMAVVKSDDTTVCLSLCVGRGGGVAMATWGDTRKSCQKLTLGFGPELNLIQFQILFKFGIQS